MANLIARSRLPSVEFSDALRETADWVLQAPRTDTLVVRRGDTARRETTLEPDSDVDAGPFEMQWSLDETLVNRHLRLDEQLTPELVFQPVDFAPGPLTFRIRASREVMLLQSADALGIRRTIMETAERRVYAPNGVAAGHRAPAPSQVIRWTYKTGLIHETRAVLGVGKDGEVEKLAGRMHIDLSEVRSGEVIGVTVMLETASPSSEDEADDTRFDVYDYRSAEESDANFTVTLQRRGIDNGGDRLVIDYDHTTYAATGTYHILVFFKAAGIS